MTSLTLSSSLRRRQFSLILLLGLWPIRLSFGWAPVYNHHRYQFHRTRMLLSRLSTRAGATIRWPKSVSRRSHDHIRLFGTKAGVSGNPPGTIAIYNEQTTLPNIDQEALKGTIHRISKLLGYDTYDVTLVLVEDDEMQATNLESRGIDKPTDILSFPFHEHIKPGVLKDPEFDIPDYYTLGDMVVDIPYVLRRCQEDKEAFDSPSLSDDEYEERGVSGAMATVFDTEYRIHMLLVHGMLHLVGHDHEEDDEYELMVTREEEIMKELGLVK
jgi:probable rRNA maturation factor